mgnify:CR=1 FL=1
MAADLDVTNEALALLGIPALSSLTDLNDLSTRTVTKVYDTTIRGLMDAAAWSFLTEYQQLTLTDPTPGVDPPWSQKKAAWQFPNVADALWRLQRLEDVSGKQIQEGYDIIAGYVHFSYKPTGIVGAIYYQEKGTSEWPPLFREAAVASIAAKLALGHMMPTMAASFFGLAQDYIELQRSAESYSAPNKRMGGGAKR